MGIVSYDFGTVEEFDRDKPALRVNGRIIRYED